MADTRYKIQNTKYKNGLSLVELVIVVGISAVLLFSFSQIIYISEVISKRAENTTKALRLAEDAMEAVRMFRDRTSWAVNGLGSLTVGNHYHPAVSGGDWAVAAGDETLGGAFQRYVRFDRVYRDANDNIAASGTEDQSSRKVTVIIQGAGSMKIPQIKLTTYLMNWK